MIDVSILIKWLDSHSNVFFINILYLNAQKFFMILVINILCIKAQRFCVDLLIQIFRSRPVESLTYGAESKINLIFTDIPLLTSCKTECFFVIYVVYRIFDLLDVTIPNKQRVLRKRLESRSPVVKLFFQDLDETERERQDQRFVLLVHRDTQMLFRIFEQRFPHRIP